MINFLALVAGLVMIPLLEPSPLALAALGLGLLLSIAIAFAYGLYISQDKPPVGTRVVMNATIVKSRYHPKRSEQWLL